MQFCLTPEGYLKESISSLVEFTIAAKMTISEPSSDEANGYSDEAPASKKRSFSSSVCTISTRFQHVSLQFDILII